MKIVRLGMLCFFSIGSLVNAGVVQLTGKVVGSNAAPLSGALVKMKHGGFSTLTGMDGSFLITEPTSIFMDFNENNFGNDPQVHGQTLIFKVAHSGDPISINLFTTDGVRIGAEVNSRLNAGVYRFSPTNISPVSTGLIIVVLKVNEHRSTHRILTLTGAKNGNGLESTNELNGNSGFKKRVLGKIEAMVTDTLIVSKELYVNRSVAIPNLISDFGSLVLNRLALDSTALIALGADSLYKLTLASFNAGTYDSTIGLAKTYLARFTKGINAENAQYYLARSLFAQGQNIASRVAFQVYIQAYPLGTSLDWSQNYIGRTYLNQNEYDSSRIWFGLVLTKYPDSSSADNAQYYTALSFYEQKNYPLAITAFNKLISTYPKSSLLADAHLYLGKSHYHQGAYQSAQTEFNLVINNFSTSYSVSDAQLGLGDVYLAMGATDSTNYPKALASFKIVVANYPKSGAITGAIEGEGESYYYLKDYANARMWLGKISTDFPLSIYVPASFYWLGRVNMQEAKYDSALVWFTKLETEYPKAEKAGITLFQMGKCQYFKKVYPAALERFMAFRTADPNSSYADNGYYYTVRIYVLQKNCVQAKLEYTAMQKLFPQSTVLASTQKYLSTGGCP